MNREEALKLLRGGEEGVKDWNRRRKAGEDIPNLNEAGLVEAHLDGADLRGADLTLANRSGADPHEADLHRADAPYPVGVKPLTP